MNYHENQKLRSLTAPQQCPTHSATIVSHSTAAEQHARAAHTHRLLIIASASGCWSSGSAASPSRRSIASGIRCARSTCAARCAAARSLQLVDPLAVYVHRVGDVGHARLEGLPADATSDCSSFLSSVKLYLAGAIVITKRAFEEFWYSGFLLLWRRLRFRLTPSHLLSVARKAAGCF